MTRDEQQRQELHRFGRWFRHFAKARGRSINSIAREADLSQTVVYALLRGDGNPTLGTLTALANVLGVDVAQLLAPIPDE